mmetsp:Transcript_6757/g.12486  ORF Transcript_6757/g.12486 Transcript_6757/m.12486 type:complete len:167 (-) Transcript_6757:507-1007(-)
MWLMSSFTTQTCSSSRPFLTLKHFGIWFSSAALPCHRYLFRYLRLQRSRHGWMSSPPPHDCVFIYNCRLENLELVADRSSTSCTLLSDLLITAVPNTKQPKIVATSPRTCHMVNVSFAKPILAKTGVVDRITTSGIMTPFATKKSTAVPSLMTQTMSKLKAHTEKM